MLILAGLPFERLRDRSEHETPIAGECTREWKNYLGHRKAQSYVPIDGVPYRGTSLIKKSPLLGNNPLPGRGGVSHE